MIYKTETEDYNGAIIELEIHFDYPPEEKQTHDYPGCPAEVELTDIYEIRETIWKGDPKKIDVWDEFCENDELMDKWESECLEYYEQQQCDINEYIGDLIHESRRER